MLKKYNIISKYGYLTINIDLDLSLQSKIIYKNKKFKLKKEFHITLLNMKNINLLVNGNYIVNKKLIKKIKKIVEKHVNSYGLNVIIKDEYKIVKRSGVESIIQMVDLKNFHILFEKLSRELGVCIPIQPFHITIYTRNSNLGINLRSFRELKELSEKINFKKYVKK